MYCHVFFGSQCIKHMTSWNCTHQITDFYHICNALKRIAYDKEQTVWLDKLIDLIKHIWLPLYANFTWRRGVTLTSVGVAVRQGRLVPGWTTIFGGIPPWYLYQATYANSASYLSGTENQYRPKGGDALRLGSRPKGRMVRSILNIVDKRVGDR